MKNKLDVSPSVGSNFLGIFYDSCHPGVIRGSYLKVHNILNPQIYTHSNRIICCSLILKTYLLALLISIATVYTPALVLGIPTFDNNSTSVVKRWTWIRLFTEFSWVDIFSCRFILILLNFMKYTKFCRARHCVPGNRHGHWVLDWRYAHCP